MDSLTSLPEGSGQHSRDEEEAMERFFPRSPGNTSSPSGGSDSDKGKSKLKKLLVILGVYAGINNPLVDKLVEKTSFLEDRPTLSWLIKAAVTIILIVYVVYYVQI